MFKNYVKIAYRNILKNKAYSILSIISLSVGMAAFLLIALYNQYELSYDKYHENSDRIYRVALDIKGLYTQADTPGLLAPVSVEEIPEVISSVRLRRISNVLFANKGITFFENDIIMSDPNIFEVFSFPFVQGDSKTALKNPNSIVLSESMAAKYFGKENPIGKSLKVNNTSNYVITGVIKDIPKNSHFRINFLTPLPVRKYNWRSSEVYTYCMLDINADPEEAEKKISGLIKTHASLEWENGRTSYNKFILQPLQNIHLHSDLMNEISGNNKITYLYVLSVIAVIILIISCINYINIATARYSGRIKEVGLRKVLGAQRKQVVGQFFFESIFIILFALILSLSVVFSVLPKLNSFAGTEIIFNIFNLKNTLTISCLTIIVCFIGGSYPAIYISKFRPVFILNKLFKKNPGSIFIRNILFIVQFSVSIILIISVLVIKNQMNFIKNKDIGLDKNGIITLRLRGADAFNNYDVIKSELLKNSNISYVSRSTVLPQSVIQATTIRIPGAPESEKKPLFYRIGVDYDFLKVYNLNLKNGRNFSPEFASDANNTIILNETASKLVGWENPVGKEYKFRENLEGIVIGEIKDFNFHSIHSEIKPIYFYLSPNSGSFLSIKINSANINASIKHIEKTMKSFLPDYPFEYRFFNEILDDLYKTEQKLEKVFILSGIISVIIACLGLFAISTFIVGQRTKEIGVRKVFGASISNIVFLLSSEYTKSIFLANIIAWPVGFFVMDKWLESFAYRIDVGLGTFILAAFLALAIAFLTISFQSIKAAKANPINSIRCE